MNKAVRDSFFRPCGVLPLDNGDAAVVKAIRSISAAALE